ncbi:hypothetical protein GN958_ATG03416 [Phytophthora infestans]|uniref:Uncharacterized protein n=1 Tax=Phytophthora infestans TaxID=4787 RepID=A0A8S9V5N2_PHYIN|nr:hypothetical protein GN958_ATG10557 [Phytophthora infestans]KAF4147407.1 hypothetical protein GN958_ATG03416 [Phytophthora infestans]
MLFEAQSKLHVLPDKYEAMTSVRTWQQQEIDGTDCLPHEGAHLQLEIIAVETLHETDNWDFFFCGVAVTEC